MPWTYQKITTLAPNSLVLEKARSLSFSRRWAGIAGDGNLLWGECRSSGERTYHTVVRLGDETFRCDCHSRYYPCRHILSLLMRFVKNPGVAPGDPPPWAQQLLKESPPRPAGEEEQAKREAERSRRFGERLELMEQGVRELEEWLLDLIRHGLSASEEQPPGFWDSFAARMVDAKLGATARRIRNFKALAGKENGFELLLEEIGELFLLAQAFRQLESLPEDMQEEALSQMGVNRKKEEVLRQPTVQDTWLVAGQITGEGEDDNLRYRRTWLLGETSSRFAMLLDFAWGRQGYDNHWVVGSSVEGELAFYPGGYPLRALFRNYKPCARPFCGKSGYATITGFAHAYARALAANPWLKTFPCLLAEVFPVQDGGQLWLVDKDGKQLPVSSDGIARWNLLAVSGGRPLQTFGEWDGKALNPLSVVADGRVAPLVGGATPPETSM